MKTGVGVYLVCGTLLLIVAYLVFRRLICRDYRDKGHLTPVSSFLELFVFAGVIFFPYLYNPPEWAWFWRYANSTGYGMWLVGFGLVISGLLLAFGTMAWFGLRRAFGLQVEGLISTGPYRITRNPQIIGGYLLVIGISFQWPSWYSVGWVVLYGVICHWMILSEEAHLWAVFGDEYNIYSKCTPRYLLKVPPFRKNEETST